MFRSIVLAIVFAVVMIAAPVGKSQKEISSANATEPVAEVVTDLLFAAVRQHPCAIIVMASNDSNATLPRVETKHKKKIATPTAKHKKKIVSVGGPHKHKHKHHHTPHAPDHHKTHAQKIPASLGPSHLTSPPGCG